MRRGPRWFAGSADAIYQSLNLIYDERPDYIVVFGADHIYRTDPRQMIAQHLEAGRGSDRRGHPDCDRAGRSVRRDRDRRRRAQRSSPSTRRRPRARSCAPGRARRCWPRWATTSSTPRSLIDVVTADAQDETSTHDIGRDIIPRLVAQGAAQVWDFAESSVPGVNRARARLLARHRDDRCLLRRAHGPHLGRARLQPLQRAVADPQAARAAAARQVRPPGAGQDGHGARLDGLRRRRRVRRGRAQLGALAGRARSFARRGRGVGAPARRRRRGPAPSCATRSSTRRCGSLRGRGSASTPTRTGSASTSHPAASS